MWMYSIVWMFFLEFGECTDVDVQQMYVFKSVPKSLGMYVCELIAYM